MQLPKYDRTQLYETTFSTPYIKLIYPSSNTNCYSMHTHAHLSYPSLARIITLPICMLDLHLLQIHILQHPNIQTRHARKEIRICPPNIILSAIHLPHLTSRRRRTDTPRHTTPPTRPAEVMRDFRLRAECIRLESTVSVLHSTPYVVEDMEYLEVLK